MNTTPKLVCFGHLTLDDIVGPQGVSRAATLGGSALYGALAARLFEAQSHMVAPVGCDFPSRARALLAAAGFLDEALPGRDAPTPWLRHASLGPYESSATLLSPPAGLAEMAPRVADVPHGFWRAKAFVIMAMPFRIQSDLAEACGARGDAMRALVLRKRDIVGKRRAYLSLIARADVLVAGLAEIAYLLDHMEPEAAARHLAASGPAVVAIDLGPRGYLVHERMGDQAFSQPAYPVAPVDPTGGADAFVAAFVACLMQPGATVKWAAAAAAVAASFAVSAPGADGALAAAPLDAARRLALFVRPGRK